ncbi:MAG TPA: stage III sporulation protein AF [Clostridiaceae bacterium]|nr:stage III sporulation protein AF [Clostridiaceae bacterium]
MIDFLKSWILNIVTLVLFIAFLEILLPSGKIKKYLNLVSGFILIITVINPFIALISSDLEIKDFQIAGSNFLDKREIEEKSKILEEQQIRQIIKVYRNKIIVQLEERVKDIDGVSDARADIIINEDYNSDEFGQVKRVYLYIKTSTESSGITPIEKIEKIDLSSPQTDQKNEDGDSYREEAGEDSEKKDEVIDTGLKKRIKEKVKKIVDIDEDNIVINIEK